MRADVCTQDAHERLKRDSDAWALLPIVAKRWQLVPEDPVIEMRNCTCGSTLCREVKEDRNAK